jgi:plastocyanin
MQPTFQITLLGFGLTLVFSMLDGIGFASSQSFSADIASRVLNNKSMDLTGNVKNVIILLPNEGHESPSMSEEARLINQPYVPENLEVSPGTNIIWFNGDVGHDHKVTAVDSNSNEVFTDEFDFNTSTRPLSLNETGSLTYSESDVNTEDPSFVMKGTITVNDDIASNIDPNGNNATFDTVALLMVPTKDLDKHISTIESEGVDVVDQFTFKDLRGGQKGTGPEQTLLVLGSGKDGPSQLISAMESLTPTLPYS